MASTVLFRADASTRIGWGHVMRCIGLAQACRRAGLKPVFICAQGGAAAARRIAEAGISLHLIAARTGSRADLALTRDWARVTKATWVVVDGYRFDASYLSALRESGPGVLAPDDSGVPRVPAGVLSYDPGVMDRGTREGRDFFGPRYALLRDEFGRWRSWRRRHPRRGRRVLITTGGASLREARAVTRVLSVPALSEFEFHVVARAPRVAASAKGPRVHWLGQVSDMARLMSEMDLVVTAGGVTTFELLYMRLPSLILALTPDQVRLARILGRAGVAVNLGPYKTLSDERLRSEVLDLAGDPERRRALAKAGRGMVDGQGADRIARRLKAAP